MKKKLQEVISQSVKQSFLDYSFFVAKIIGFVILFIILYVNITASQAISPLYFKVSNDDKSAVISFLKKIKSLPEYGQYLSMSRAIYGDEIEQEINQDYFKRKDEIEKIEAVLNKNPKSRDILYVLSGLYKDQKDEAKSNFYLEKAKEIDPTIK